jgi:hypothetical protein
MSKKPKLANYAQKKREKAKDRERETQNKYELGEAKRAKPAITESPSELNPTSYIQYGLAALFLTAITRQVYDSHSQKRLNETAMPGSTTTPSKVISPYAETMLATLALNKAIPAPLRLMAFAQALWPKTSAQPEKEGFTTAFMPAVTFKGAYNQTLTLNQLIERGDLEQASERLTFLSEQPNKKEFNRYMTEFAQTTLEPAVMKLLVSDLEALYLEDNRPKLKRHLEKLYKTLTPTVITKAIRETWEASIDNKMSGRRLFANIALDHLFELTRERGDLSAAPEQYLLMAKIHFDIYSNANAVHSGDLSIAETHSRVGLIIKPKGKTAEELLRLHYKIMAAIRKTTKKTTEANIFADIDTEHKIIRRTTSHLQTHIPTVLAPLKNLHTKWAIEEHRIKEERNLLVNVSPENAWRPEEKVIMVDGQERHLTEEQQKVIEEIISFVETYRQKDPKVALAEFNAIINRAEPSFISTYIPGHFSLYHRAALELDQKLELRLIRLFQFSEAWNSIGLFTTGKNLNGILMQYMPENLDAPLFIAEAHILEGNTQKAKKALNDVAKLMDIVELPKESNIYHRWLYLKDQLRRPLEKRKCLARVMYGLDPETRGDSGKIEQRHEEALQLNFRLLKTSSVLDEAEDSATTDLELAIRKLESDLRFEHYDISNQPLSDGFEGQKALLAEYRDRLSFQYKVKAFALTMVSVISSSFPVRYLWRQHKKTSDKKNKARDRANLLFSFFKTPTFTWQWRFSDRNNSLDCRLQMTLPQENHETIQLETEEGHFNIRKDFFLAILRRHMKKVKEKGSSLELEGEHLAEVFDPFKSELEKAFRFQGSSFCSTLSGIGLFKNLGYIEPRVFELPLPLSEKTILNLDGHQITFGNKMLFEILSKAFETYKEKTHSSKLIFVKNQASNSFTIRLNKLGEDLENFENNAGESIKELTIQYTKLYFITGETFFDRWTYRPIDLNQEGETKKAFQFDANNFKQEANHQDGELKSRHLTYLMAKNLERLREAEQRKQADDSNESLIVFCKGEKNNEHLLYAEVTPRMINAEDEKLPGIDLSSIHPFADTTSYLSQLEASKRKRNTSTEGKDDNPILHHTPDQLSTNEQRTADIRFAIAERNRRKNEAEEHEKPIMEEAQTRNGSPSIKQANTASSKNLSDDVELCLRNLHDLSSQLENIQANFEFKALEINDNTFKNKAKRTMLRLLLSRFFFYVEQLASEAGSNFSMQPYSQMRHILAKCDVIITIHEEGTKHNPAYHFYNALWKELSEKEPNIEGRLPTMTEVIQREIKKILNGSAEYRPESFFEIFDELREFSTYKKLQDWRLTTPEGKNQQEAKDNLSDRISERSAPSKVEALKANIKCLKALKESDLFEKYYRIFNAYSSNQETEYNALLLLPHPFVRLLLQTIVDITVLSHDLRKVAKEEKKLNGNKELKDFLKSNKAFEHWTNTAYKEIRNSYWHDGYIDPRLIKNAFTAARATSLNKLTNMLGVTLEKEDPSAALDISHSNLDPEAPAFEYRPPSPISILSSGPSLFEGEAVSKDSAETPQIIGVPG